ncbi:hypothetical protein CTAYLR_009857 [Chrysophaeum taylorii]|uniref:Uncharacterized protein n=1 Tax=Chrysophaeum taylorii TaxID=2483200 RepID=A0AAD7XEY5_9STRA|nr:hypothetical protein CTAYLR_009857 [Chrysophaeum taylorii]
MEIDPPIDLVVPGGDRDPEEVDEEEHGGFDLRKQLGGLIRGAQLKPGIEELRTRATRGIAAAKHFSSNVKNFSLDALQDKDPYMVGRDDGPTTGSGDAATTGSGDAEDGGRAAEVRRAKEAALREARAVEARAAGETRELRARLAEATGEVSRLRREAALAESDKKDAVAAADRYRAEADQAKAQAQRVATASGWAQAEISREREAAAAARAEAAAAADSRARAEAEVSRLASAADALRGGREDIEALVRQRERQAIEAQGRAARSEREIARYVRETAEAARAAEAATRRARSAETEVETLRERVAVLRERLAEPRATTPREPPPAADERADDRLERARAEVAEARSAALRSEDARRDAERQVADLKRLLGVEDARYAKTAAERDAAVGAADAAERRATALGDELAAARRDIGDARRERDAARASLTGRVESDRLRLAEARAEAARRQVVALDRALDACDARNAAAAAVRDADVAAIQRRLRDANDQLQACKEDLDRKRGQKAFFFSGQLRRELRRLERANDVLRQMTGEDDDRSAEDGAPSKPPPPRAPPPPPPRNNGTAPEEEEFDARVRCEYFATSMLRVADDDCPSAKSAVAPVVRELLGCPHNPVSIWLDLVRSNTQFAVACRAAMELILDALETARAHCEKAATAASETAAVACDRRVAETAASTARDLARIRADADAQVTDARRRIHDAEHRADASRVALDEADREARRRVQDATLQMRDMQRRLDAAAEQTVRAERTINAMKADKTTPAESSPEAEHARLCVLRILREAKVNGPSYNRLLPVVREILKLPHNVVTRNLDALIATGSAPEFVEALSDIHKAAL